MTANLTRISAVDPLRVILAIFVIGIHTNFPDGMPDLPKQTLVNGLFRIAVPIFALISGYFFLGAVRKGTGLAYLRRILILYLIWTVLYLPIYGRDLESIPHALQLWTFGYFHLWFLAGMVVAGAFLLLLIRLQVPLKGILVLAVIMALIGVTGQYLVMTGRADLSLDQYRNGMFVIFPFFSTGYVLAASSITSLPYAKPLAVLSVLAVMAESLIWYRVSGGMFGVDTMVSLLVCAPLVFLAALSMKGWGNGKQLATLSAFIYFSHIAAMVTASRLGLDGNPKALFVLALCIAVWAVLNATSPGRRILGWVT